MELVYRSLFVFGFLWFITRVTGRATLGELSTFQLLLYVVMGDLVQQAVTQQDYSVTSSVLAVGVFALMTVFVSWLNMRIPRLRPLVHGVPVVLVDHGQPLPEVLELAAEGEQDEKSGKDPDPGEPHLQRLAERQPHRQQRAQQQDNAHGVIDDLG